MFEGLMEFARQFGLLIIDPMAIALMTASSLLGILIGALPGLTATMGIALMTGLTYSASKVYALTILMGVYIGAIYGGSMSAILLNVPGTPSAAATALDGHQLARKGLAAEAIWVTRTASVIGTFLGIICLATITPLITKLALNFTSAEFFLLAVFGVLICGSISARDLPIKGWIAGLLGMFMAMIGIEDIHAAERFSMGMMELATGVPLIPAMIGFFAFPQIVKALRKGPTGVLPVIEQGKMKTSLWPVIRNNIALILRSTGIGVFIGALPGVGEDVAAWLSYDNAKRSCKNGKDFGTGVYEGAIAPEVGNNAAIGGAMIPLLSLAVPGSPPAAVLLGALLLHGIRPGPMLTQEFPTFTAEITALMLLATIILWFCGVLIAKPITKVLRVPQGILMPIVAVLSIIGAYALNLNTFDLVVLFVAGIVGYALDEMGYSAAPIILGLILGGMIDSNFRRMLMISDGSLAPLYTRPICIIFLVLILWIVLGPLISKKLGGKFKQIAENTGE